MRCRCRYFAALVVMMCGATEASMRSQNGNFLVAAASRAPSAQKRASSDERGLRQHQRDTSFLRSAAAGGAAAAAATVTFHPIDTVKVVLQGGGVGGVAAMRALGAKGLYRGVLPAAFSMMPACAVRMGAYEVLKGALLTHAPKDVPPSVSVFLASACSVVISCTVRTPLDMIKTKVQADATVGAAAALRSAWGTGGAVGLANLYRGAGLALVRDVPFFGFNLLIYEQLKAGALARATARAAAAASCPTACKKDGSCSRRNGGSGCCCRGGSCTMAASSAGGEPVTTVQLTPLELLLIGFAAQGIAGFLTNPADVLKTRVQSGSASGVANAFQAAMRDGGPQALMRGAGMRVLWIAPQGCVYYPAYEAAQSFLQRVGL